MRIEHMLALTAPFSWQLWHRPPMRHNHRRSLVIWIPVKAMTGRNS